MSEQKRTITINDKQYNFDELSALAKTQLLNIKLTDAEIRQLQTRLGIAQTARGVYAATLQAELEK